MEHLIRYIWPSIKDSHDAGEAAFQGVAAAAACILLSFSGAHSSIIGIPLLDRTGVFMVADAVFFAVIALGIYRMSRAAAVAGAAFFLLDKSIAFASCGLFHSVAAVAVLFSYMNSIRGTFAYHIFQPKRKTDSRRGLSTIMKRLESHASGHLVRLKAVLNSRIQLQRIGAIALALLAPLILITSTVENHDQPKISEQPHSPRMTMQQALDMWMNSREKLPPDCRELADLVQTKLYWNEINEIHKELLDIESLSKMADNPLIPLREAIMNSVNRSLFTAAIMNLDYERKNRIQRKLAYTDDMLGFEHVSNLFIYNILRFYSMKKYNDGAAEDWFTFYVKTAHSSVMTKIAAFSSGMSKAGRSTVFSGTRQLVAHHIKEKLLHAPPGMPFGKEGTSEVTHSARL
ncbi:MAG: hypothetical protein V1736_03035 [Pseudomonadota bacterium]